MANKMPSSWLIWSHEHRGYWPRSQSGYVALQDAGLFTLEEAVTIVTQANQSLSVGVRSRLGLPEESMLPDPRIP